MKTTNWYLLLFFIVALIFRLLLTPFGFHDDLIVHAGWGDWLYKHGPKGFYENQVWIYAWPTQPPLGILVDGFNFYIFQRLLWFFSYVAAVISVHNIFPQYFGWFFDFVKWFGIKLYSETPFPWGFVISIKLLPILADLIIGVIILILAIKAKASHLMFFLAIFLMSPFSWYISSVWGQFDQLSTLLLLVSFLLLYKRYFFLSALFLLFSGQIKPTSAYFLPFYIFYFFYQRPNLKNVALSIGGVITAFWVMTAPFADRDPFNYTLQVIFQKVFFVERFEGLVNRAFNLWQFLEPFGGRSWFRYLGISAAIWGYLSLIVFHIWAILILLKKNDFKNMMMGLYLIAGGSYLFGVGMVDRYFFPAVVFLIILTIYNYKLWKLCTLTVLLFSLNLFYSWGFPFLNKYEAWQNSFFIRSLSLAQILMFFLCLRDLKMFEVLVSFKNKTVGFLRNIF